LPTPGWFVLALQQVEGSAAPARDTSGTVIDLILGASPVSKAVLVILVLFSIVSWGIVLYKTFAFRRLERQCRAARRPAGHRLHHPGRLSRRRRLPDAPRPKQRCSLHIPLAARGETRVNAVIAPSPLGARPRERHQNLPRFVWMTQGHAPPPYHLGDPTHRVDPQRIADQRDLLTRPPSCHHISPRPDPGQPRHQPR